MKYLSLFSGIGGFELGIDQGYESLRNAHGSEIRGGKENTAGDERQGLFAKEGKDIDATERSTSERPADFIDQRPLCIGYSEIDKYAVQIYQKHFPEHKNYGDITKIQPHTLPDFDLIVGGFPCQAFSIAGKRMGFADTRGTLFFDIARILKQKQPRYLLLENVKGLLSHERGDTFTTIISTLDELGYDVQWQVLNSKNFGVPQNRERVFIVGHLRGTSRPEVFPFGADGGQVVEIRNEGSCEDSREFKSKERWAAERRKIRRLTPIECERLQGFPDGWTEGISDTQRYKTLGNAVTVNVIREIMKKVLPPTINK